MVYPSDHTRFGSIECHALCRKGTQKLLVKVTEWESPGYEIPASAHPAGRGMYRPECRIALELYDCPEWQRNNGKSPAAAKMVEILTGHADARKSLQKCTLAWVETGMELPDRGIAGVLYEAHRLDAGVLVSVSCCGPCWINAGSCAYAKTVENNRQ
ncbi:Hypothetical predicted protein [Drosophila guanche]|uniref:Uncharacterized protein n=1 Tax=Drosophila guanche TaxID=7266 RepID=A0A3B0J4U6_DROGU|nr:Hypothetical predicted protein [Drosophila guanche]